MMTNFKHGLFFFFQVVIEFVTILLLLYVLAFWLQGTWDPSSPTRDRTRTPCTGRRCPNHWTAREAPKHGLLSPVFIKSSGVGAVRNPFVNLTKNIKRVSQKMNTLTNTLNLANSELFNGQGILDLSGTAL